MLFSVFRFYNSFARVFFCFVGRFYSYSWTLPGVVGMVRYAFSCAFGMGARKKQKAEFLNNYSVILIVKYILIEYRLCLEWKQRWKWEKKKRTREKMAEWQKTVDLRLYSVVAKRRLNGMSKNKQTKTLSGSADKLLHIERRAKCLPIYEYVAREWKRDRMRSAHSINVPCKSLSLTDLQTAAAPQSYSLWMGIASGFCFLFRCVALSLSN